MKRKNPIEESRRYVENAKKATTGSPSPMTLSTGALRCYRASIPCGDAEDQG